MFLLLSYNISSQHSKQRSLKFSKANVLTTLYNISSQHSKQRSAQLFSLSSMPYALYPSFIANNPKLSKQLYANRFLNPLNNEVLNTFLNSFPSALCPTLFILLSLQTILNYLNSEALNFLNSFP